MRRSRQLVVESAVIAAILLLIALGGSIATTLIPPSFASLDNPGSVTKQYDLGALALYYNVTLSDIGTSRFTNASFLLDTFHFANIPPAVNQTALAANADLASVNSTVPRAVLDFHLAGSALAAKEYLNATVLVNAGCAQARLANQSLADFQGPQTSRFKSLSVPTAQYAGGASLTAAEVQGLFADCSRLLGVLPPSPSTPTSTSSTSTSTPTANDVLTISSPQKTIETGGAVVLNGTLTLSGAGVGGQAAVFYINGTYFGSLVTSGSGNLGGTLTIPFLYKPVAMVQAAVAPNATQRIGGAFSNLLNFTILFNQTSIVIGDPPAYLPTQSFHASGNLTTTSGVALPSAPVTVTFLGQSVMATTNVKGEFGATLTVPANATDGTYYVYAAFSPQGVFGPSFNFTSIRVVHMPLDLTVSAPFSFAGFHTELTGSAVANGTSVPGARIVVDTPWGSYATVTDSSGRFRVGLTVSPFDFSFAGQVRATAAPTEPYMASGSAFASMRLFNILIVILPAVVLVTVTYEADKMGAFEGLRKRRRREAASAEEAPLTAGEEILAARAAKAPELVSMYQTALGLASARFGLRFEQGQTIREALDYAKAAEQSKGYEEFCRISLTTEDFLYARSFDVSRLERARRDLGSLEGYWR